MKYLVWTADCQMNVLIMRVASALERLGYAATDSPEQADVIVLNTCVVRRRRGQGVRLADLLTPAQVSTAGDGDQSDGLPGGREG
jgi:tRNA-2-methylthio-N6-dimethylallyladenosine synthase